MAVPIFHLLVSGLPRTFQPDRSLPLKRMTILSSAKANVARAKRVTEDASQRFMEGLLRWVKCHLTRAGDRFNTEKVWTRRPPTGQYGLTGSSSLERNRCPTERSATF